jgi:hypothetical protein
MGVSCVAGYILPFSFLGQLYTLLYPQHVKRNSELTQVYKGTRGSVVG